MDNSQVFQEDDEVLQLPYDAKTTNMKLFLILYDSLDMVILAMCLDVILQGLEIRKERSVRKKNREH